MGSAVSSSLERNSGRRSWPRLAALGRGGVGMGDLVPDVGDDRRGRAGCAVPRRPAPAKPPDKLVIDADELIYDKDKNTVTAQGSVQLFYQGRLLQADRVVYNRVTKRVYAEGHAKMTDEHGDIVYGTRFELSENFRDGFIDSVQALTSDKTRFTSPRGERMNGDVTVLEKGSYTACEPCKDHPERPPFWQVRATKIIENQETHTVYYEGAQMLVWGFPVFYMPYFSSPDSTVNKQTGLLAPQFVSGGYLGYGLSLPYFINLAPNYDLTLIPTYLSKQGFLGEVDWRQRLTNGQYSIKVTGIDEQQPNVFPVLSLRRWRSADARVDRNQRQLLPQSGLAVRLGWDLVVGQVLRQRLQAAGHRFQQLLFPGHHLVDLPARPGRPQLLRPQRLSFSGNDGERRQPHPASGRAGIRLQSRVHASGRSHERDRRRSDGRRQHHQHHADQRGVPVHRPADLRQRLPSLQCLRDGGRRQICEHLLSRRLHAPEHRGRLHPGVGASLLAAQLHRHDRRGVEAVRVRPPRRRSRPNSTRPVRSPTRVRSERARSPTPARRRSSRAAIRARLRAAWRASDWSGSIRSR